MTEIAFAKGHGTENDFVLIPDSAGKIDLTPDQIARICDRHAGIGGDGLIRVVRTEATDDPAAVAARGEAEWFMDYWNSDGSPSEMCGNGARVFGLFVRTHADVDLRAPLKVATRAGIKTLTFGGGQITVDMGAPQVLEPTWVAVDGRRWDAVHVDLGNPHAVAFVDDLADAGTLDEQPGFDAAVYPNGANVEFVHRSGEAAIEMRVHERGSGETRSCGTGACAAMVAAAIADESPRGTSYAVTVPGGRLDIVWTEDDRILMTGPAEIVAEGVLTL